MPRCCSYVNARLAPFFAAAVGISVALAVSAQPATKPAKPIPTNPPGQKPPSPEIERLVQEKNKLEAGVIRHGVKDPIPKPAGAVRFATYNIENLFDTPSAGGDEENRSGTEAKPVDHRKAVADAIKRIDADVLAVQEIESEAVLTKFRDEYLSDLGYTYIASIDAGDPRGIEQSVLSRFPLKDGKVWKNLPLKGVQPEKLGKKDNKDAGKPLVLKRSPFKVNVDIPGAPPIAILSVHHKSGAFYSFQREAEAARIVELVKEITTADPKTGVLVMGDFNAKAEEKAVQTYLGTDASGKEGGGGMVDAFAGLDPKNPQYMTHVSGRDIDHILMTPNLASLLNKQTRFILGTIQRQEKADWRTTPAPKGYGSDHYPVVVDLMISK